MKKTYCDICGFEFKPKISLFSTHLKSRRYKEYYMHVSLEFDSSKTSNPDCCETCLINLLLEAIEEWKIKNLPETRGDYTSRGAK